MLEIVLSPASRGGDAYFTFLDADDAWASSYLAKFMTALLVGVSPPDIVSLGSMYVPEDFDWRTHPLKDSQREECFYGAEVCLLRMWSSPTCPFAQVTDKFWRAEVFRNNRFLAGMRYGEDSIFVWEASLRATSLVESGYRGYFYRSTPTSAVNTPHRVAALQEWYLKTKIVLHLATQLRPRQEWATPIFSYSAFFGQRLKWFLPWCQRKSIVFQLSPAFLSYLGTRKGRLVYWMQLMLRFSALLVMLVPLGVANLLGKWRWIR